MMSWSMETEIFASRTSLVVFERGVCGVRKEWIGVCGFYIAK